MYSGVSQEEISSAWIPIIPSPQEEEKTEEEE
jgi:hypothetical protein